MKVPDEARIRAPEFPPGTAWLNSPPLRMSELAGEAVALIEFFDVGRVNSHRTLPYLRAWHGRYGEHGLEVIGVHSPGYSFGVEQDVVEAAVARMEIPYPVALDSALEIWRAYGNRGWPGRYLFGGDGLLRWAQYGEGDYAGCERAIQDALAALDPAFVGQATLDPLRPEDAEGVLLSPQTADIALPGDSERLELAGEWTPGVDYLEAAAAGATARVRSFSAGGAYAVLGGAGVAEPGVHASDGAVEAPAAGFRLYGFQFTPAPR